MHEKCVMEWHIVKAEMMIYQKFIRSKSDFPLHVSP